MIDDRLYHRNDRDDRTRARSDECAREKEAFVRGGTLRRLTRYNGPTRSPSLPSLLPPVCLKECSPSQKGGVMDGATEMGFNLVLLKRGDRRGLTPLSSFPVSDLGPAFVRWSSAFLPKGKVWPGHAPDRVQ